MNTTILILALAGTGLLNGYASQETAISASPPASSAIADSAPKGYDDRQIARIQRGETTEAQLLEWFGLPESRKVNPDGRAELSWGFSRRTDGATGGSGILQVSLTPDRKAESYSARGGNPEAHRTVDIVDKSAADMKAHMAQWQQEGWSVLSVSVAQTQADGTIRRKAELSRSDNGSASGFGYNDGQIAAIKRGETTQNPLLEWFGPAYSRTMNPDGRTQLAWKFARRTDGGPGHSGDLGVSLAPDGKVDSYSARPGQ